MFAIEFQFGNNEDDLRSIPDKNKKYLITPIIATTGLTCLMKYVLLANTHPQLLDSIIDTVDINTINEQTEITGWTALMIAVRNCTGCSSERAVKMLLKKGADVNKQNTYGCTALMLAAIHCNGDSSLSTVKMLLEKGADVNIQDISGLTALMALAYYCHNDSLDVVIKMMLEKGANVNIQSNTGWTALMYVMNRQKDSQKVLKMLLEKGADINKKTKRGDTALYIAIRNHNVSNCNNVKLLLEMDANLSDVNELLTNGEKIMLYEIKMKLDAAKIVKYEKQINEIRTIRKIMSERDVMNSVVLNYV